MKKIIFSKFILLLFIFILLINIPTLLIAKNDLQDLEKYQGKTIVGIKIKGLSTITEEEVFSLLPFRINEKLDITLLSKAISNLYNTGYFENIVIYINSVNNDNIKLIIKVTEKPIILNFKITGNKKIKTDDLKNVVSIQEGDFFSERKLDNTIRSIKEKYLSEGYENVKIEVKKNTTDKGIKIEINIIEPKRLKVHTISFIGNKVFSSSKLKSVMETKTFLQIIFEIRKGAFLQTTFESDLEKIIDLYYSKGYLDANIKKVDKKIIEREKDKLLNITIYIDEGKQYFLKKFNINDNKLFTKEEILTYVLKDEKIKIGSYYNRVFFKKLIEKIRDFYSQYGYIYVQGDLSEDVNKETREVNVSINLYEGEKVHVEKIFVKGNSKTKDYVIFRELMVDEGEVFNANKLRQSVMNLYNTQYFSNIDVQMKPGDDPSLINLIILLEEQRTANFSFGASYTPGIEMGFGLQTSYQDINFLGRGYSIKETGNLGVNNANISLSFQDKWFLNEPINFGIDISYSFTRFTNKPIDMNEDGIPDPFSSWDEYNYAVTNYSDFKDRYSDWLKNYISDKISFSMLLGKRWIPYFSASIGWSIGANRYRNEENNDYIFAPASENANLSIAFTNFGKWVLFDSLVVNFKWDTRDFYLFPRKGFLYKQSFTYTGGLLGGDIQYLKTNSAFNINFLTFWDIVLSLNLSAAFIFPQFNGDLVLNSEDYLFISGYNESRGWLNLMNFLGRAKFVFSLEFQRIIVKNIVSGVAFIDFASLLNSPENLNSISLKNFYNSIGVGAKLQIPSLPIRIYFAKRFIIEDGAIKFIDYGWDNWSFVFSVGDMIF